MLKGADPNSLQLERCVTENIKEENWEHGIEYGPMFQVKCILQIKIRNEV